MEDPLIRHESADPLRLAVQRRERGEKKVNNSSVVGCRDGRWKIENHRRSKRRKKKWKNQFDPGPRLTELSFGVVVCGEYY